MKVLFNCHVPFSLAHGGAQIQIEQTMAGLRQIGVEAEPLRWWDGSQQGDIFHHFGRIPNPLFRMAKEKGLRVVTTDLLTSLGSRPPFQLMLQKAFIAWTARLLPRPFIESLSLDCYRHSDACVANTPHEAFLMRYLYGAAAEKVHVVPNGVEAVFFESRKVPRGSWLVCTATITPRKRVLELAHAAVIAGTPLWVIGKPYDPSEPYAREFLELAARNPAALRYEGAVNDRARLAAVYREARGFVLLSTMETRSLSSEEAAACECPMLLSDLPWARNVFKDSVRYCGVGLSTEDTARHLRAFYDEAPALPPAPRPLSWVDVARAYHAIYQSTLTNGPRPGAGINPEPGPLR